MERWAALLEAAKNVGVVLTSSAALAYAAGYLALRARAHALGTDPGFALVDQTYVFAGFRFTLQTLVALLCILPPLMLIRAAARWISALLKQRFRKATAWVAALTLAALTLASLTTLEVEAVLLGNARLGHDALDRLLTPSILGEGSVGTMITLGATLTAALSVLWFYTRVVSPTSGAEPIGGAPLTCVLAVVALLQLILLPVQHGVFYADRNGRALARIPDGVTGVLPPVWLLDRGTDRASLFARAPDGKLCLLTIKVDALDGIPVTRIAPIHNIVRELAPVGGLP